MTTKAKINRANKAKDRAYMDYVDALIEHDGNGANAIVAGKRRRFEKATMELHEELKRGASK